MWTSWRNDVLTVFLLAAGVSTVGATPLGTVSVFVTAGSYTAGVSTNTDGTSLRVDCFKSGGGAPDAVETVNIFLLKNGQTVNGGMSALSFNTSPGIVSYCGVAAPCAFTLFAANTGFNLRAIAANTPSTNHDSVTAFDVVPNVPIKLIVLAPGMVLDPGKDYLIPSNVGWTGASVEQQPGQTFALTVVKTDRWFNQVASAGPTISFASGDLVTLPAPAPLASSGQGTFNVTIGNSHKVVTLTATGASPWTGGAGTVGVNMGGPEPERVFPFPSPFNPSKDGQMYFRVVLNNPETITVVVKDRFGQDVWHRDVSGAQGQTDVAWDGRNENGNVVAAGIYDVLLKVGTAVKSKKRFGVVK